MDSTDGAPWMGLHARRHACVDRSSAGRPRARIHATPKVKADARVSTMAVHNPDDDMPNYRVTRPEERGQAARP